MPENVTIEVAQGPTIIVPWSAGMNVQQAMELAYAQSQPSGFSFAIQYYGSQLGYLVIMIDGQYESINPPLSYWEFFYNGSPAQKGIDSIILNAGDVAAFELQPYSAATHSNSTVQAKHNLRVGANK